MAGPQGQHKKKRLRGTQKVAALILAMGKATASRLLKHFDDEEVAAIAASGAGLGIIAPSALDDIVNEFAQTCTAGRELEGGAVEIEALLSGVIPADQLLEVMAQVRGQRHKAVWPKLSSSAPNAIAHYLAREHPQMAAFVLSQVSATCSANTMLVMPPDQRNEIMRRMASISSITHKALALLETTLDDELVVAARRDTGQDIYANIANIINKMEREQMDGVLHSLFAHRPKEAQIVKGLLFTFEDISRITQEARLKLFDNVSPERLIIALKGCEPSLKELILASVAARSRRMIESELEHATPTSPKDIRKMRRAIADLALEMADRGEIEIRAKE